MPRYPQVRTGDLSWDGIHNVITEHIVYNNESELFPRFRSILKEQATHDERLKVEEAHSINFTQYLARQEKRDKNRNKALFAIIGMLTPILGDLIWYWIRSGFHLTNVVK